MKLSDEFKKAMRDPKAVAFGIELTAERKKRYEKISTDMIDWLTDRTDTPFEAYMILQFVTESLKSMYGITSGAIINEGEHGDG